MVTVPGRFRALFSVLRPDTVMDLEGVYAEDVVFDDPVHRAEGLPPLRTHFERLNANLREARFVFTEDVVSDGAAMLAWTMHLDLARGPRRTVVVERDYFDVGAMVYEQIPLVGTFLRFVRSRIG